MKSQILQLRQEGKTYCEISKLTGRTLHSVRYQCNPKSRQIRKHDVNCLFCDIPLKENRQTKFCNSSCFAKWSYKTYIERWKAGLEAGSKDSHGEGVSRYIRRYMFDKYNNKCCKCGWDKINPFTGKRPLQINHIDGDHKNIIEDNLELICPGCHSLTENYGSRNKGKGRTIRKRTPIGDGDCLESSCTLTGLVGSTPSASAITKD